MDRICYMLIGLPGSGKSFLSENLMKEMPHLQLVSTDIYIEKEAKEKGKTYNEMYREVGEDADKWMKLQIKKNIASNTSFIWDQTNVYASARKKKIAMLSQNKYKVVAIALHLSTEELLKRTEKREMQGGKKVSSKVVKELQENYALPEYSEGFEDIYLIEDDGVPKQLQKSETKFKI